jgi:tetratricopeptide (TPR) repeat protein
MRNRFQKPPASPLNAKETAKNQAKFSLEKLEEELQAAFEDGDDDRVLELLDSAPQWVKNQPEFALFRASALVSLGHAPEALHLLLEVERKNPRFTEIYPSLALLYMDRECPAHALQFARRALANRSLPDEARESLAPLLSEATAELQHLTDKFGISMETMQQASMFHEKALLAMDDHKLVEVDYYAQKALKLIPAWNSPHNNRAKALYFTGKPGEAIGIVEGVLARDAVNVFALSSMTTFLYGLDQLEQARVYASRLEALVPQFALDSMEIELAITALALVEDTAALWKIARRYLDQPADTLFGRSWHCLAVAAARSGKLKNALDLMEKADEEGELSPAGEKFLDHLFKAKRMRKPRLAWMPPEYPGADLLMDPRAISELESLLNGFSAPYTPAQQQKLDSHLKKYPFIKMGLKRLLWGEDALSKIPEMLATFNQPDLDAEILRFGSSQVGSQDARMGAFLALMQAGRYTGSKVIKLWNEELEEWQEVALNTQRIGEIEFKIQPKTMAWIEKALRAKKPEEAIALLRKAVEIEPTNAMALFNLGVQLANNGNTEEGNALIYRSVSVDPSYTYGHVSIALTEAGDGNEQAALDHLEFVTKADVITPDTAVIANLAWSVLALNKKDLKSARSHFDLAATLNPEHRLLKIYAENLENAEKFGAIFEFQRESVIRAHQKQLKNVLTPGIKLQACLEMNTKDMLAGSAKFLRTSSAGRKAELTSRFARNLLDEDFLKATLEEDLAENEREALRWILEASGVREWNEFVRKYGDDMYESTYWVYHQPESIPGRLKLSGLLYSGTLEGQQVAFIPPDVRPLLLKLLNKSME